MAQLVLKMFSFRTIILLALVFISPPLFAHHWFQESHEMDTLLTIEVEVVENRFINPHPFFSARVIDRLEESVQDFGDLDAVWQLQMDNRWELQELGFSHDTLKPGDKLIVTAHPGSFKRNTLYVKALEHLRLGFRYEHNVRKLFDLP